MVSSAQTPITASVISSMMGMSRLTTMRWHVIGIRTAARPRTSAMLQMFEPNTLPTAIMLLPLRDEITVTTNSGADVPNATTVSPITIAGIPKLRARFEDPFTSHSAP